MFQGPGLTLPTPPMLCLLSLGRGFLTKIADFSEDSLLRSSSRDILLWRGSGQRIPYSSS